jgi:hypothetical protein
MTLTLEKIVSSQSEFLKAPFSRLGRDTVRRSETFVASDTRAVWALTLERDTVRMKPKNN